MTSRIVFYLKSKLRKWVCSVWNSSFIFLNKKEELKIAEFFLSTSFNWVCGSYVGYRITQVLALWMSNAISVIRSSISQSETKYISTYTLPPTPTYIARYGGCTATVIWHQMVLSWSAGGWWCDCYGKWQWESMTSVKSTHLHICLCVGWCHIQLPYTPTHPFINSPSHQISID